jgi:hypothetical protein
MPVYTFNTPQGQNQISATTNLIQQNFEAIRDWTDVDHVQITGAGGNEGKHNKVSLIQQVWVAGGGFTPAINLATGRGTLGIFAALNAANDPNSQSRMWAVIPRKTAAAWEIVNIPFTESTILGTNPTDGIPGYSWLPSGILIQWGGVSVTISDTTSFFTGTATFPIPFPKAIFRIIISNVATTDNNGCAAVADDSARTLNGFTATARAFFIGATGPNSRSFNYIAIGC